MTREVLIPSRVAPSALRGASSGLAVRTATGESMGTTWKLRYQLPRDGDPGTIRLLVENALALVVGQMSHWDENSELSRFNRAAAGSWHELSPEFFEVLDRAVAIARDSGGACDPTLGRLVDLHGFGPVEADSLPHPADLDEARSRSGWTRLRLDLDHALQPGGCQLDLSSIAKGYAVDLASRALLAFGLRDFLFELGGELRSHGCKPDGQPWWASIDTPPDLPETVVALCDLSLATSGAAMRRRITGDGETNHLIDPATGSPTTHAVESVSVISADCIDADAWATALHVAGPDRGPALAESRGLAALFILRTPDGHHRIATSALQRMLD